MNLEVEGQPVPPQPPRRLVRERLRQALASPERLALLASAVFGVGGIALAPRETPPGWVGGALLAAAATLLLRVGGGRLRVRASAWREPRRVLGLQISPLAALVDAACVLTVLAVGTIMMWEIASGERPVSHD